MSIWLQNGIVGVIVFFSLIYVLKKFVLGRWLKTRRGASSGSGSCSDGCGTCGSCAAPAPDKTPADVPRADAQAGVQAKVHAVTFHSRIL